MKTTRKEIYRIYGKESVISLGYCKIQSIVNYLTKIGHTERLEGWAADIYELPEPYNGYSCLHWLRSIRNEQRKNA